MVDGEIKEPNKVLEEHTSQQSQVDEATQLSRPLYPLWFSDERQLYLFPSQKDWCKQNAMSALYLVIRPHTAYVDEGQSVRDEPPVQGIQRRLQDALPRLDGAKRTDEGGGKRLSGAEISQGQCLTLPIALDSGSLAPLCIPILAEIANNRFICEMVGYSQTTNQWLYVDEFLFARKDVIAQGLPCHTLLFAHKAYTSDARWNQETAQEDLVLLGALSHTDMQTPGTLLARAKELYGSRKDQTGIVFLAQSLIDGQWQEAQWLSPSLSMYMSVADHYRTPSFQTAPKRHLPNEGTAIANSQIAVQVEQAAQQKQASLALYLGTHEDDHELALRSLFAFHWQAIGQPNTQHSGQQEEHGNLKLASLDELGEPVEKDGGVYFNYTPHDLLVSDVVGFGCFEPFLKARFEWQKSLVDEGTSALYIRHSMVQFVYTGQQFSLVDEKAQSHVANKDRFSQFEQAMSEQVFGLHLDPQYGAAVWRRLFQNTLWQEQGGQNDRYGPLQDALNKGEISPLALSCLMALEASGASSKLYMSEPYQAILAQNIAVLFGEDASDIPLNIGSSETRQNPLAFFLAHKGFDQVQVNWALEHAPFGQILIWDMASKNDPALRQLLARHIRIDRPLQAGDDTQAQLVHNLRVLNQMEAGHFVHLEAMINAELEHWPHATPALKASVHWRTKILPHSKREGQSAVTIDLTQMQVLMGAFDHARRLWDGWIEALSLPMSLILSPRRPDFFSFDKAPALEQGEDALSLKAKINIQFADIGERDETLSPHADIALRHCDEISDPFFLALVSEQLAQDQTYRGSFREQFRSLLADLDLEQSQLDVLSQSNLNPNDWIGHSSQELRQTYEQNLKEYLNRVEEKKSALFDQLSRPQQELELASFDEKFAPLRRAAPLIVWMGVKDPVDTSAWEAGQTMGKVLRGLTSAQSNAGDLRLDLARLAADYGTLLQAGRHTLGHRRKHLDEIDQLLAKIG